MEILLKWRGASRVPEALTGAEVAAECLRFARLPKVLETVRQMLIARGYLVRLLEPHDGPKMCGEKGPCERIHVFYDALGPKLGIKSIREFAETAKKCGGDHLLAVANGGATSYVARAVEQRVDGVRVEIFSTAQLRVNITRHSLYFPHRKLSDAERVNVLKKVKAQDLPVLAITDAVSRFMGFQRGDVIEIERRYAWTGTLLYYRLVQ